MRARRGMTSIELVVVVTLIALGAAVAVPRLTRVRSNGRTAAAARQVAVSFRALRWSSVARGQARGWFFGRDAAGWHWVVVRDGNGNGLRTAEVRAGVDPLESGPHRLEHAFEGVGPGFPDLPSVPRIPPGSGRLTGLDDPIRFGRSDLVSFSPTGSSSSGTIYLSDGRSLYAVVLFGPSARTRVWRFDAAQNRWARR